MQPLKNSASVSLLDPQTLIIKPWDKEIFKFNGRCYYCQIDFEAELKGNGKFGEWKEAQDKRIKEGYIEKFEKENEELVKEIEKCKDNKAVRQVGIEWGIQQSKELMEAGVPLVHYYSMGKSSNIEAIAKEVF